MFANNGIFLANSIINNKLIYLMVKYVHRNINAGTHVDLLININFIVPIPSEIRMLCKHGETE